MELTVCLSVYLSVYLFMYLSFKRMDIEKVDLSNESHTAKVYRRKEKEKHTVGLEPTISCSVGKRLIQLGYACLLQILNVAILVLLSYILFLS